MVLLLWPIGCGAPPPPSGPAVSFDPCQPLAVVIDSGVTEAQAAAVEAGLALWNARARSRLWWSRAEELPAPPILPLHFQAAAPPFHGLYDDQRGEVYINTDLDGHARVVTVAHEVGHAFGLAHVPPDQRVSVMNPGNLLNEPSSADIDTLAVDWGRCP
jgi:hypothetical protein